MNLNKLNAFAFRATCILISLFLVIGAVGMLEEHYTIKAIIGFIATVIILIIGFRKPNWLNWVAVFIVLSVAMILVALIDK